MTLLWGYHGRLESVDGRPVFLKWGLRPENLDLICPKQVISRGGDFPIIHTKRNKSIAFIALLVVGVFVFAPASKIQAAPLAAYAFDEGTGTTTADAAGNNPGTLANSPVWTAGRYGNALQFNATDDGNDNNDPRVVLGRDLNFALPFTISAWVNPVDFADWRAIFSKRDSASPSNMRFDIGLSSGSGSVYIYTANSWLDFNYIPPVNTWTHLAVVAQASGTQLYVNGTLQQTREAITLGTNTTANTVIGGTGEGTDGDNDPFNGGIDDLRLYARALTQTEIQDDMNTPVGGTP